MNFNIPWWGYVILAGLAWGTYVPIIFYGGQELTKVGNPLGGRLGSILCVGVAYFVLGVVIPLLFMTSRSDATPEWKTTGLIFSGLAGVAGAVGAICVIFASKGAVDAARAAGATTPEEIARYRVYIAPLIFSLAPMINTLVSLLWHPKAGEPWRFYLEVPGWKLLAGILLVAGGTFLVLMSKEDAETRKAHAPKPATVPAAPGVATSAPAVPGVDVQNAPAKT